MLFFILYELLVFSQSGDILIPDDDDHARIQKLLSEGVQLRYHFFFSLMREEGSKHHSYLAIIGQPARVMPFK